MNIIKLFSRFWVNRTGLEKLFIIIITVGFIYTSIVTIQKAVYKYRYFKEVEQQYNIAKDSLDALNIRLKDLTEKQQTKTNNAKRTSKAINDKLKDDEKIIDNKPISNDELDEFLSRYDD